MAYNLVMSCRHNKKSPSFGYIFFENMAEASTVKRYNYLY